MNSHVQNTLAAVAAIGVVSGAYCFYRYCQNKRKLPQKWRQVGTLKHLNVYPIKSCGKVPVENAECTSLGLRKDWLRDRVFMIVDDSYNFITARVYNELLLVNPAFNSSILTLNHPDMDNIQVDVAEVMATQSVQKATVWGNEVPVYNCGTETSKWFTKLLNRPSNNYHLVYYASQECRRSVDPRNKYFNFTKNDTGAFPDDTSYNLINEATVEDLNNRLEDKVTAFQFRPNFIISGCKPYDEDSWTFVKIGENIFEIIMPCLRCVLTTYDPETGVRNANNEPLQTLKGYRQHNKETIRKAFGSAPRMGLQMALRSGPGGVLSLDDPVYVA